jgi:hypothetical protein
MILARHHPEWQAEENRRTDPGKDKAGERPG